MFFSQEDLIKGHETCFDVITVLLGCSWLLFTAAILHTIATVVVNIVARKAIEARSITANNELNSIQTPLNADVQET